MVGCCADCRCGRLLPLPRPPPRLMPDDPEGMVGCGRVPEGVVGCGGDSLGVVGCGGDPEGVADCGGDPQDAVGCCEDCRYSELEFSGMGEEAVLALLN